MERLQEMDVRTSRYEGPTGILGVLHDAFRRAHIETATLWAAAPHYLAATPNIKVTAALLTYLNRFLSFGLDLTDIQSDATQFEEQVTALVARDPEASEYVRRLEERIASGIDLDDDDDDDDDDEDLTPYLDRDHAHERTPGTGPLPSADSLIRDVEELLRKQRENRPSDTSDDNNEETE
jgi:hypothetical protein